MEISEILNIVLGGGLAGTLLSVLTLRESVKKAQARQGVRRRTLRR